MKYPSRILAVVCATFVILTLAANRSGAELVFLGQNIIQPAGVGTQVEILGVQGHNGDSIEDGAVAWSGSGDVKTGDAKNGAHTKTRTFAELGNPNGYSLFIYLNVNDPGPGASGRDHITLESLVLNVHSPGGGRQFLSQTYMFLCRSRCAPLGRCGGISALHGIGKPMPSL